jgi:dUTP pyrophosphatase
MEDKNARKIIYTDGDKICVTQLPTPSAETYGLAETEKPRLKYKDPYNCTIQDLLNISEDECFTMPYYGRSVQVVRKDSCLRDPIADDRRNQALYVLKDTYNNMTHTLSAKEMTRFLAMLNTSIKFKRLSPLATLPKKAHTTDAGFDISNIGVVMATNNVKLTDEETLKPGNVYKFHTGISMIVPQNYYCRVAPRSGLANKYGLQILAGVIDENYTGEIMILATVVYECSFKIGDKIAQLILEKIHDTSASEFVSDEDYDFIVKFNNDDKMGNIRHTSGFGSSDSTNH